MTCVKVDLGLADEKHTNFQKIKKKFYVQSTNFRKIQMD